MNSEKVRIWEQELRFCTSPTFADGLALTIQRQIVSCVHAMVWSAAGRAMPLSIAGTLIQWFKKLAAT